MHPKSGFQIAPDWSLLGKYQWRYNSLNWHHRQSFDVIVFFLSGLDIGPSFMLIPSLVVELWQFLFIRDLSRNLETENPPTWAFPNTCRLRRIRDTKFCTNVSSKNLFNVEKFLVCNINHFWVIRENQQRRW